MSQRIVADAKNDYVLTAMLMKGSQGALDTAQLLKIAQAYGADTFVETGTYLGDTAAAAAPLFQEVHTVELSQELYQQAAQRFGADDHVHVYQGDSADVLDSLIPRLTGRAVFWLDGHYNEGITAKGRDNTPILDELRALARHGTAEHVLLIDDISLFRSAPASPATAPSLTDYPTVATLREAILEVNPEYTFAVVGDIALALPPRPGASVSPFIQAVTLSRLFEDEDAEIDVIWEVEQTIAQADAQERGCVEQWLAQSASREAHGLGAHFRLWQGLILLQRGSAEQAAEEFDKAQRLGLTHWRVWWYLAQATHKAEQTERAREAVEAVLAAAPQFVLPAGYKHYRRAKTDSPQDALRRADAWQDGQPLRLHLGCGEKMLPGYVNVDYPSSEHNVMTVRPDLCADIATLEFPSASVDEIRLHHVFEHFNRVTALAMLIRWHRWLKPGGKLHIETPDLMGSAQTLVSAASFKTKMGVVRHLAGDQAASWAYHIDHWFPERYNHTLEQLGFSSVQSSSQSWPHEPYLSNVTVLAWKLNDRSEQEQLAAADALLWESTVSPLERPTFDVWCRQLRAVLGNTGSAGVEEFKAPEMALLPQHVAPLQQGASTVPLQEIYGYNQSERDKWVTARAATIPAGSRVLDLGAGTCPYRPLFAHCDYRTHDFMQYEGVKLGGTSQYGHIDYVSDVKNIPAPDGFFDVILCTEVLEHVPEPIEALREMARLLRPGGRLLVSAPLGSGLHQLPYHYYGGYTPGWYQHFGTTFGLDIKEILPNGGFFKLLAQECARVAWTLPEHQHLHGANVGAIQQLFGDLLPRYLFALDERHPMTQFTVGYHVEAIKSRDVVSIQSLIEQDYSSVPLYVEAALARIAAGDPTGAFRYYEDACELNAEHPSLANLHFYFQTAGVAK